MKEKKNLIIVGVVLVGIIFLSLSISFVSNDNKKLEEIQNNNEIIIIENKKQY